MDVRIVVSHGDRRAELESLQDWLGDSGEMRGRVEAREQPAPRGALGPVLDSLLIALAPGSVATALATALVSWIRHRNGGVRIEIELPDGRRVKLEADRVRELTEAQLRGQVTSLVAALTALDEGVAAGTEQVAGATHTGAGAGGAGADD
jgi:hypothetical protein